MNSTSESKPAILLRINDLFKQAIAEAVEVNRKLGTPIYVMQDGQIVDISKDPPEPINL